MEGRCVGRAPGGIEVDVASIRFVAAHAGVGDGEPVDVLLRPEDLSLAPAGAGRIDGRVLTSAFFGAHHELSVATPIGKIRLRDRAAHEPGSAVAITWPDVAGIAYPRSGSASEASGAPMAAPGVAPAADAVEG
jgi:ABC-type Fe3+/spermidine/putrescine transport system ATPase subunit